MSTIGLDVGTSRVKAVRFDGAWQAVDSCDVATEVQRGADGRREQDMDGVWTACAQVLRAVAQRSPDTVDLLAVTAQGDGCWLVDGALRPIGPALLWNDSRAAGIVQRWEEDGVSERAFRISGSAGAPGLASGQLRWLAEHDADRIAAARHLLSCGSWIHACLTGRAVLEASDAADPFCAAKTGAYDDTLLDLFGLGAQSRLLTEIVRGADLIAPLTVAAATDTGLPVGTPVSLAPYDVPAAAVGLGVRAPGDALGVLGTTFCVAGLADDPGLDRTPAGFTLPYATGSTDDHWLRAHATMVGTEALDWAAQVLGLADAGEVAALAASADPARAPVLAPYLSPAGERSPFVDPAVRGTLTGLELTHGGADIAYAVLEGLCFAVLDCLRAGLTADGLAVCGGAARSEVVCRTLASATGLPVDAPDTAEVGARGAVLAAAVADGWFADLADAAGHAITSGARFEPDGGATELLHERYRRMVTARDALR